MMKYLLVVFLIGTAFAADCNRDIPPDAKATCAEQKGWNKCGFSWMKGFCCKSCGCPECAPKPPTPTPSGAPVMLGMNLAWNKFGRDFVDYDETYFTNFFQDLKDNNLNTARVWVHCDGGATPNINWQNHQVTGVTQHFLDNLNKMAYLAGQKGIVLMLTLWSFDMTKAKNLGDIITDNAKTTLYIDNALSKIVAAVDQYDHVTWDIFNEPEWSANESKDEKTPNKIPLASIQRFVGRIASYIRHKTSQTVTVGSASLKWNSDVNPAEGNWWSDDDLYKQTKDVNARLHYYSPHVYDWCIESRYDPFSFSTGFWKFDKPAIVGEAPATSAHYSSVDLPKKAMASGFRGFLSWDYNEHDPDSKRSEFSRNTALAALKSAAVGKNTNFKSLVGWLKSLTAGQIREIEFNTKETSHNTRDFALGSIVGSVTVMVVVAVVVVVSRRRRIQPTSGTYEMLQL